MFCHLKSFDDIKQKNICVNDPDEVVLSGRRRNSWQLGALWAGWEPSHPKPAMGGGRVF
jgi:hypothetical protein